MGNIIVNTRYKNDAGLERQAYRGVGERNDFCPTQAFGDSRTVLPVIVVSKNGINPHWRCQRLQNASYMLDRHVLAADHPSYPIVAEQKYQIRFGCVGHCNNTLYLRVVNERSTGVEISNYRNPQAA